MFRMLTAFRMLRVIIVFRVFRMIQAVCLWMLIPVGVFRISTGFRGFLFSLVVAPAPAAGREGKQQANKQEGLPCSAIESFHRMKFF
jgi:hypothetical protein